MNLEGIFLNEGIGGGYYRDELQRIFPGSTVYTRSNNPSFHDTIKKLLLNLLNDGYKLPITFNKNTLLGLTAMLGEKIPLYAKTNIMVGYLVIDASLTFSLPSLIFIDGKSRDIVAVYTLLLDNNNNLLIKCIAINRNLNDSELNKLMKDLAQAIDRTLS